MKLARGYVLEFVWLMQAYVAARRADVEELLRTPSITRWEERDRAKQLVVRVPDELRTE